MTNVKFVDAFHARDKWGGALRVAPVAFNPSMLAVSTADDGRSSSAWLSADDVALLHKFLGRWLKGRRLCDANLKQLSISHDQTEV